MKILFVDDEQAVLDGLERSLFMTAPDWEATFVLSGPKALALLATQPFDVIVSDMRMPEMDGATLLREVAERFPSMIRVVLSGQADEDSAMRAVLVAQQFLAKPCKPELMRETVESTLAVRELLASNACRDLVGRAKTLPAIPRTFAAISHEMANPDVDLKRIGKLVAQDPAVAAKVLQIVNSAFFARRTQVASVQMAVSRLGLRAVRSIVLCSELFCHHDGARAIAAEDLDAMQAQVLRACDLVSELAPDRVVAEQCASAALLTEFGRLVIGVAAPDAYRQIRDLNAKGTLWADAERQVLGVSHAELGGYVLGLWGLPTATIKAVAFHHSPDRALKAGQWGPEAVVFVAAALAEGRSVAPDVVAAAGAPASVVGLFEQGGVHGASR